MRQYKRGKISGALHVSIGQEAAIVGACLALRDDDAMTGTHRSHGHPIGKGAHLDALMAELMGKEGGICKGRGGSMHLADNSVGIIGESAIVGAGHSSCNRARAERPGMGRRPGYALLFWRADAKELAHRASRNALKLSEISGGSFSLSNLAPFSPWDALRPGFCQITSATRKSQQC
nr:thiamine pyrophosphate-dependent enzyme [Bradyrhizobium yuanmingense]